MMFGTVGQPVYSTENGGEVTVGLVVMVVVVVRCDRQHGFGAPHQNVPEISEA